MTTATKSCFHIDISRMNDLVKATEADPAKAQFTFSTETHWVDGAITETTARGKAIRADEPAALGGSDSAPDPVELLLASLASCVSIGLVTQAAKRGVEFRSMDITVEGNLDVRGYFGDASVRPGFSDVRYTVRVGSDAPPEVLATILQEAERTSPMFDNIRNGTRIASHLEIAGT